MSIKFIQNQDLTKLEREVNKALAEGKMRLHSVTTGGGMFVAVLESKPKPPAAKPETAKAKPAAAKTKTKAAEKDQAEPKR